MAAIAFILCFAAFTAAQVSVTTYTNAGASQDEYNANSGGVFKEYDLGPVTFNTAGNYTFKFTAVRHNASSTGYTVAVDYINLTPQ